MTASTIQTTPQSVVDVLYDGLARRLEQIVRADVRAPETIVEDACQFAWGSLVAQVARVHSEATLAWLTKTAVNRGLDSDEETLGVLERLVSDVVAQTPDAREGIAAFRDGRRPNWAAVG